MKQPLVPVAFFAAVLCVTLAGAQTFDVQLNINSETTRVAGESPGDTRYFAWPFISASDDMGDDLTQQVQVSSPSGHFQGYVNHPNGWSASSLVMYQRVDLENELFNNGDWEIRDFTDITAGVLDGEQVYHFSVSGDDGALDALISTVIDDNAHLLDLDAPVFSWNNPGGLFEAVNVYLIDRSGGGYTYVDTALLGGDANSYAPSLSLNPGTPYRLEVNQRRNGTGLITATQPSGYDPDTDEAIPFPYEWSFGYDLNSIGAYEFTAVPEPHEYAALAGAGLLGFALWRHARRSARA